MANEFVIKNGFISNGNGFINNNLWVSGNTNLNLLTASTVNLSTIPTNNNSATQVLVRNTSTGDIEYRDSSSISPSAVTDTYVTGFTYISSANTLTIKQNEGQPDLSALIDRFSALTLNNLYVSNNISVSGTSNLTTVTAETISNVDYIDFNIAYTGSSVEGRLQWSPDDGGPIVGMAGGAVTLQIGQETYYHIKNQSGATIQNGRVVRAAGTLGASGRILGEYMIADGSIEQKYTLGVATENILNGSDGFVTEFGLVRGINTTGSLYGETWSNGDVLWVHPSIPGGMTNVQPQSPNIKIEVAMVVYANANGSIFVRPNRYPHVHDLQEVNYSAGTEGDMDILQWSSALSAFTITNTPSFNSISAITISANTYYGDGSNLTGISVSGATSPYKTYVMTSGSTYTFSDFTSVNTLAINKTIGSKTTVILDQSPNINDFFVVKDKKGDSYLNDIIVSGGTYTIDGNTSVKIKNTNKPSLTFLFDGLEYIII